jgi:hypothetical protein
LYWWNQSEWLRESRAKVRSERQEESLEKTEREKFARELTPFCLLCRRRARWLPDARREFGDAQLKLD